MALAVKCAKATVVLVLFWTFVAKKTNGQSADSLRHMTSVLMSQDSSKIVRNDSVAFDTSLRWQVRVVAVQQILTGDSAVFAAATFSSKPANHTLVVSNIMDTLISPDLKLSPSKLYDAELSALKTPLKALARVDTIAQMVSEKIDSIKGKVARQLGGVSKTGGGIPGPGSDLLTVNRFNIDDQSSRTRINIPDAAVLLKNLNLSTPLEDNPQDWLRLPEYDLEEIEGLEKISGLQGPIGEITEVGGNLKKYQENLAQLNDGDLTKLQELPGIIESKVENLEELESLQKASQEFSDLKSKWNDPEVVKEQALNEAKETAVNHFAGREEELKSAMEKLSNLKSKIPDPEGTLDLFAERQRLMKEKTLLERFVPGMALQFQKQESYWVDLNPYLGFKIAGRWLAGLGWNERIDYNFDDRNWDSENRIYGLRSFLHFKVKEKLWLKSDVECMNAPLHALPLMTSEVIGRRWIWSFFAGFKKDIEISKRFNATVQTMYNIYNPDKRSPYTHRLNIRIGFELPLKKGASGRLGKSK